MRTIRHVVVGLCAAATLTFLSLQSQGAGITDQLDLLGQVIQQVRDNYVVKPDDEKLIENAINGMLTKLDPHSSYMTAKELREMRSSTSGKFGGVGLQVQMEDGLVKVVEPIEDSPGARAGMLAGDLITQIDEEQVK